MKEFIQQIQKAKNIGITGHIHPDGDCIGSCLGLKQYILDQYPEKTIDVYLEPIGNEFYFLNGSDQILSQDSGQTYDLFFVLDCSSTDRFEPFQKMVETAKYVICIDHHISNHGLGDYCKVDPTASATCEVLCQIFSMDKVSKKCAQCLYTGIVHDTGVFKHSNTTKQTMIYAGELLEKGVESSKIIDETFYQKTYIQNRILGQALINSFLCCHDQVIYSSISKEELEYFEATSADLNGIIDQLRVTKGTEVAVFLYPQKEGSLKVSMRSNEKVDVAKIAEQFGGGGHIRAAGCTIFGSFDDTKQKIIEKIEEQL